MPRSLEAACESSLHFLITCEHASPAFPEELRTRQPSNLPTHRFSDPGACEIASLMAKLLNAPLFCGKWSRLVTDLNRSTHHQNVSFIAKNRQEKALLLKNYWYPFRDEVRSNLKKIFADPHTHVIHLSVHTFTPIIDGCPRSTELGLLYDPRRVKEKSLAQECLQMLRNKLPDKTIHANQPYRGVSDGHVTHLRKIYPKNKYIGFELEYSSDWAKKDAKHIAEVTATALKEAVGNYSSTATTR